MKKGCQVGKVHISGVNFQEMTSMHLATILPNLCYSLYRQLVLGYTAMFLRAVPCFDLD